MRIACRLILGTLFLISPGSIRAGDDAPSIVVTKDDHVFFLGGEIPPRGSATQYHQLVAQAFENATRTQLRVRSFRASSNTLLLVKAGLDTTLQGKPTLVVLFTGTNDIRYDDKLRARAAVRNAAVNARPVQRLSPEHFTATLGEIVDRCTQAEARILLCTAAVIGERYDGSNPLDSALDEYSELTRKFAAEHKIALCDLRKEFIQYEKAHNPDNNTSGILTSDGTILNEAGHQFLAEALMMHLGIEPTK